MAYPIYIYYQDATDDDYDFFRITEDMPVVDKAITRDLLMVEIYQTYNVYKIVGSTE